MARFIPTKCLATSWPVYFIYSDGVLPRFRNWRDKPFTSYLDVLLYFPVLHRREQTTLRQKKSSSGTLDPKHIAFAILHSRPMETEKSIGEFFFGPDFNPATQSYGLLNGRRKWPDSTAP